MPKYFSLGKYLYIYVSDPIPLMSHLEYRDLVLQIPVSPFRCGFLHMAQLRLVYVLSYLYSFSVLFKDRPQVAVLFPMYGYLVLSRVLLERFIVRTDSSIRH